MSIQKKLPTRRDRREAEGYLTDLLNHTHGVIGEMGDQVADTLISAAAEVKVQRATDRLVLYFDLDEDPEGALPEATTDAAGVDNDGEREAPGRPSAVREGYAGDPLSEFTKGE